MTAVWRDPVSPEDPCHAWIRSCPALDSKKYLTYTCDVDEVVLNYGQRRAGRVDRSVQRQIAIEFKAHNSSPDTQQLENLSILDYYLRLPGHPIEICVQGRSRWVLNHGVHVLRMSGDRPDRSDWLTWSSVSGGRLTRERFITLDQCVALLRGELHPDTLEPLDQWTM